MNRSFSLENNFQQFLQANKQQQVWSMLEFWALQHPDKVALVDYRSPDKPACTFAELYHRACGMTSALINLGATPHQKALIFLRPSLNFHPLIFALFRLQIIPIFIDPSMPRGEFLKAVKLLRPEIIIAEPIAIWFSRFYSEEFASLTLSITSKKSFALDLPCLEDFPEASPLEVAKLPWAKDDNLAAILYTSGGTGIPKAVPYTHSIFWHQTLNLRELFGLTEHDRDYPGFPLFSMFTLCLGMQSGITQIDPRGPARCNPEAVARDLVQSQATFAAGSPAIWEKVARHARHHGMVFPHLKFLTLFGAPVSLRLHREWAPLLPQGTTYTPYGATEALPVACISGQEILRQFSTLIFEGRGTCVGRPAPGIEIAIIPITDEVFTQAQELPTLLPGEPGEICVKGPVATSEYLFQSEETELSRVHTAHGFWHRMGDLGYLDKNGFLWFMGRKKHRLDACGALISTETVEATYNDHPEVQRCALIWARNPKGERVPTLAIERTDGKKLCRKDAQKFEKHLFEFSARNPQARQVSHFVYVKKMPVDVRHNIKIDRQKLSEKFCGKFSKIY
ncbi:MAG: AMP-binding protein [Bdellovibrio sp.]|nr:AMP-binding protein [Bdellovibrio sp.]